ncbi:putative bifunctional diguanylate cyclase/phosphodiesterase [Angustibacter sp. McL0619]|uniref:putative bifunctional diguanylate cyclase/phosphodiesterase n=1 Tax=Angustibacter sp. McL0619 TaxID=3415676 RepID=UPI003CFB976E
MPSRLPLATFYAVVVLVYAAFTVSTLPGVRQNPGYNLFLDGWLNNVAYMLSPLVCLTRARAAGSYTRSWRVLAVGLALYGMGNVYWTVYIRPLTPEPFPSPADGLWLTFYGFAFVALLLIVREAANQLPVSLWLDGIVAGLAVAAVMAAIAGPVLAVTGGGSLPAVVTTLAYPLLDVVLLLIVTAVLALFHWRPPAGLWFLVAGLTAFVVADLVYLFHAANGTYQPGGVNDAVWVLATLLMAFAPGWSKRPAGAALPSWVLLGVPVGATVVAVALLVFANAHRLHPVAIGLAAATVMAAIGRLIVTFGEVRALAHSRQLALTDELTGLGNRRAFYEQVEARTHSLGAPPAGALLLLDLDRFKEVNDSLGHHAGDDLLCQVAGRLANVLHGNDDLLARLGGDEFAIYLSLPDGASETVKVAAEHVAERVHAVLEPPFTVEGVTVRVDASVGISHFPAHGREVAGLLRAADVAMYQAKSARTGHSSYNSDGDLNGGQDRLRLLEELREAVLGGGLSVFYQPKVDSKSLRVDGVEALVRWAHPTKGLLLPDSFLPLAEQSGLMRDLTTAVLVQSLDQVKDWRDRGRTLAVAVNLSASSLVDVELPQRVAQILACRGLPPESLELEITEDFLMGDRERARSILTELRSLGIRVSVDDFGTGYSSLTYLRELPIDQLKLDRSFVLPMSEDTRAAAIVRSTIALAHSLGMTMVAEGVEDAATALELAACGCDESQGFYFSRALPPAELEQWLDDRVIPAPPADSAVIQSAP